MDLLDDAQLDRLPDTLEIYEIAELWFGDSPGPEHSERFHKRFHEFVDDLDRAYDEGILPAKREERSQDGNISIIAPRPYYIFVYRHDFFSWLAAPVPADSLISRWQPKTRSITREVTHETSRDAGRDTPIRDLYDRTLIGFWKKHGRAPSGREFFHALKDYDQDNLIREYKADVLYWMSGQPLKLKSAKNRLADAKTRLKTLPSKKHPNIVPT